MYSKNSFRNYQKSSVSLTSFLFSKPVSFYGKCYEKQEKPGTSYQSVFRFPNMFKNFPQ